jgi:quercetin dioxygenase-like cupin family protein
MTVAPNGRPYALDPDAGTPMIWFTSKITLKASSPDLGVTEVTMSPGEEPPVHVHKNEDEWFFLVEGEMRFHVGDEVFRGTAGSFVSFPRGISHTFTIDSESARFLVMTTPGGFEKIFELAPKTSEEAARAMEAFGMTFVAPHPRDLSNRSEASSHISRV